MAMRKLKHHEQKLLKKVDFLWSNRHEQNVRELKILRRYHIQDREDYWKYNKICGMITKMAAKLKKLPASDPYRIAVTEQLLDKAFDMGLIPTKTSLAKVERIAASTLCRRRLPVVSRSCWFQHPRVCARVHPSERAAGDGGSSSKRAVTATPFCLSCCFCLRAQSAR